MNEVEQELADWLRGVTRQCDCCGRLVPIEEIATTGPTFAADEAQACEQCRGAVL